MRAYVLSMCGLAALFGCSSPNPASNAAGAAGTSTSMAGTTAGGSAGAAQGNGGTGGAQGGSSAGQSASGEAGGGAANSAHYGQVLVQSLTRGASGPSVSARFVESATPSGTVCNSVADGPCRATTCDMAVAGGSSTITYASAGTVTITSPEVIGTATLTPSADGSYLAPTQMPFEKAFLGAELLQIKATGSTVPAFEGELNVPLVLLFSQPAFVAAQPTFEAPRSQDLSLVWTRGVAGVALYVLGSSQRPDGQPGVASIHCNFPSEPGNGVIKSSLLQQLKPDAQLNLLTVATKVVMAGDYSVTLGATLPAANPDKAILPNLVLK